MKLQTSLKANHLVRTDWLDQFNKQQQNYLRKCVEQGIDISSFAKPEYSQLKMKFLCEAYADPIINDCMMFSIRRAIEDRRQWLSNPKDQCRFARFVYEEFNDLQLDELAIGLSRGVNVDLYAHRSLNYEEMHVIRRGLEIDVNVLNLVHNGHDLIEIHQKLGIDNFL